MGELAERLDNIRVRASAPGMDVHAELRDRTEFSLSFGESVYEFADERALERALASVARLLYAGWQRQYQDAISWTNLDTEPRDQHDFDFQAACRAVESYGESSDGRFALSAVGMDEFTARIKRGSLRELREEEFAARVVEAATVLVRDYQAKTTELKWRYYG
ncbi:hypothetical protein CDG81_22670 [Actinopolyspora erythraea]|uniref:Uncharacterized protein n=1 Tax=Actinopolyspora erythraea TaxID=414996 RepID=A0A099DAA7_9ACTN|nr:hypothetical protein [Actinopolyspora erythraea]ASU80609.1 hypothetical protein CDG81_22670 [Actinopolyspora erythraea]KGI82712.1 hypothetical protein IL38_02155 [Actinopolyspora erythraea]